LGKLQGVVNFYECLNKTLLVYVARYFFSPSKISNGEQSL